MLAAQVPAGPVAPTTSISALNLQISWARPDNGGSIITSYVIKVRSSASVFYTVTCDESSADQLLSFICTVPISSLIVSPFSLAWGSSAYAKVTAVNVYGNSVVSSEGNGAIILTVPDAPTNLANNKAISTGTKIGLTWAQGLSNGGTPVIDFTLSYKYDALPYAVLASAITT